MRCPTLQTQADETDVQQLLSNAPGIGAVEIDVENHLIHVLTTNQDGGVDVITRLRNAGFPPVLLL
jgi:hypothetical protein